MIDYSKRNTLKVLGGTTAAVAAGGVSAAVTSIYPSNGRRDNTIGNSSSAFPELSQLEVSSRVGVVSNDLEVVIKNTADSDVTITHMTPRVARVARGEFDFSALLADGPLHLGSGESVVVPIQQAAINTNASPLSDVLKNSLSVITNADSYASVSIVGRGAIA